MSNPIFSLHIIDHETTTQRNVNANITSIPQAIHILGCLKEQYDQIENFILAKTDMGLDDIRALVQFVVDDWQKTPESPEGAPK